MAFCRVIITKKNDLQSLFSSTVTPDPSTSTSLTSITGTRPLSLLWPSAEVHCHHKKETLHFPVQLLEKLTKLNENFGQCMLILKI